AAIVNNDKAMARDKAIEDALRRAVEQVVGTMVTSESKAKDFQLLEDSIYTHSKGYVESYKIVSEKVEDNVYIVDIQADVSTGKIEGKLKAIGIALSRKGKPRVMFLISEQNVGQETPSYWWGTTASVSDIGIVENTMINIFQKNGFTVIDRQAVSGKIKVKDAYRVASLSSDAAKSIANQTDAQIVIFGQAIAKSLGNQPIGTSPDSPKYPTASANMSVRALNTDNGEIIATATGEHVYPHPSEISAGNNALKMAAEKVSNQLIDGIMEKWNQELSGGQMVSIDITGIDDPGFLSEFKNFLTQQIRGVQGVQIRKFKKPDASLDIDYKGKGQDLGLELSGKKIGKSVLEVTDMQQNSVKIKVTKAGK
ncbi:MAG: flagellar assembly protein T N-terminal domain-containing protein, partial [Deltaproteobacteria bacterium]|nr:flagellar assembly protein T N-terminal domain-containing protein [Deltaproteobacteria bacterium]